MADTRLATLTGSLPAKLANTLSDAIHAALSAGMETDEACCVALGVIGDYWVTQYALDDEALEAFSAILKATNDPQRRGTHG